MRTTFFLLALAAIPMPVSADWQGTKWGMTSVEVVKATGNRVKANPDAAADDDEKWMMPYVEGGVQFTAYFAFDDQSGKLVKITLRPDNQACRKAFDAFSAKYGPPASSVQGAMGDMVKWQDAAGSNRIMALALPSRNAANDCTINYRPLTPPAK